MPTPSRKFSRIMAIMAIGYTTGFMLSLILLMFVPVPTENRELVSMMLGHLSGFVAATVTYHFGSTQESADKNQVIATQAETQRATYQALAAATPANPDTTVQLEPGQAAQAPPQTEEPLP